MDEEEGKEEKETVYDEKGKEEQVEDGQISSEEAGFMQGYDAADEEEKEDEDEEEKEE